MQLVSRGFATSAKKVGSGRLQVSLLLSRIPIVTPELTKLEEHYYKYQSELERRLMWTFPHYFYFKKGTLSQAKFEAAQSGPISKLPNVWFPKGVPDVRHNRERREKQTVVLPRDDSGSEDAKKTGKEDLSRPIVPNSRTTKADETNDTKSLERKLSRTLQLVVKNSEGKWVFPKFDVSESPLHSTAEDGLRSIGGDNIHTWTVSKKPIGVVESNDGQKEFLIKSHILAGVFELQKSNFKDYAWLTKEEIENSFDKKYYENIEFLLANN